MDERIVTLNIEHLRRELEREEDPERRKALLQRLAEEEGKLRNLDVRRGRRRRG